MVAIPVTRSATMRDRLNDRTAPDADRHARRTHADDAAAFGSLFTDPDARGARRWSHMFDPERCERAGDAALTTILPQFGQISHADR